MGKFLTLVFLFRSKAIPEPAEYPGYFTYLRIS
jgi:hypothetical protein